MRWRVGLIDVTAAVVVTIVILLPAREAKVAGAHYDRVNQKAVPDDTRRHISALQAKLEANPADTVAADDFAEVLSRFGQTDDALRVAGAAAKAAEPNHWRALLTIATVHSDRIEFETARVWTDKALEACAAAKESCPSDAPTRIKLFADELDRAIKAVADGFNPRIDPKGFREAMDARRLPPIRVN